jgi:hypothetical protein
MKTASKYLEQILAKNNRVANLQVVFVDVEKYSKRRTLTQTEVIDRFTSCLNAALTATSKEYIEYAQNNDINFQTDIVGLPTGDGAAIIFPFGGLHDIHLFFAKRLLLEIHEANSRTPCPKYNEHGWCNCHPNLDVRVGISEGKGIVYRDINQNYNIAGAVINMATRVMGMGDKNQIMFTEEAYRQIIDMIDDPLLVERFREYKEVRIKHDVRINVYQYLGEGEAYINSELPEDLSLMVRAEAMMKSMEKVGNVMSASAESPSSMKDALTILESLVSIFNVDSSTKPHHHIKDVDREEN